MEEEKLDSESGITESVRVKRLVSLFDNIANETEDDEEFQNVNYKHNYVDDNNSEGKYRHITTEIKGNADNKSESLISQNREIKDETNELENAESHDDNENQNIDSESESNTHYHNDAQHLKTEDYREEFSNMDETSETIKIKYRSTEKFTKLFESLHKEPEDLEGENIDIERDDINEFQRNMIEDIKFDMTNDRNVYDGLRENELKNADIELELIKNQFMDKKFESKSKDDCTIIKNIENEPENQDNNPKYVNCDTENTGDNYQNLEEEYETNEIKYRNKVRRRSLLENISRKPEDFEEIQNIHSELEITDNQFAYNKLENSINDYDTNNEDKLESHENNVSDPEYIHDNTQNKHNATKNIKKYHNNDKRPELLETEDDDIKEEWQYMNEESETINIENRNTLNEHGNKIMLDYKHESTKKVRNFRNLDNSYANIDHINDEDKGKCEVNDYKNEKSEDQHSHQYVFRGRVSAYIIC